MNKQEILENISIQFEQMIEQFEVICQHTDKIPQAEMDKMLGEARATYELFVVLNHVNNAVPEKSNSLLSKIQQTKQMMASMNTKVEVPVETIATPEETKIIETPAQETTIEETVISPVIEAEVKKEEVVKPIEEVVIPNALEEKVETPTEEIKIEEPAKVAPSIVEEVTNTVIAEVKTAVEIPTVLAEEKPATETPIMAEEIKAPVIETTTEPAAKPAEIVNEQEKVASTVSQVENPFAKKINPEGGPKGIHNKSLEEEDGFIADKIGVKIADLKKNVALHEKFLYINELFGGNNNAYNEMIDALEAAENAQKASEILAHYGNKFSWNPEGKTFKQLRLLIQRRF